jgi:hypothetical protein
MERYWIETIMSKTDDASWLGTLEDDDTLADSELAAVTGGRTVGGFPSASAGALGYTMHIPQGVPVPPTPRPVR